MVFLTGDTHSNFRRFSTKRFKEQKEMTRNDYIIILGDFGGVWNDSKSEKYWLDWLSHKPFTICFLDGNHENFDRLLSNEFETVDFHGGKAHKIRENIYYLMRGYVFDFEGKKFFVMGGASSHDIDDGILDPGKFQTPKEFKAEYKKWDKQNKLFRVNHYSWWEQELPNQVEMDLGMKNLAINQWKVDYVLSHSLPQVVASVLSMGCYKADSITCYLNKLLENNIDFGSWYCGHYHENKTLMGRYHVLYEEIERII